MAAITIKAKHHDIVAATAMGITCDLVLRAFMVLFAPVSHEPLAPEALGKKNMKLCLRNTVPIKEGLQSLVRWQRSGVEFGKADVCPKTFNSRSRDVVSEAGTYQ
jgi:hypothetical protein